MELRRYQSEIFTRKAWKRGVTHKQTNHIWFYVSELKYSKLDDLEVFEKNIKHDLFPIQEENIIREIANLPLLTEA